MRRARAPLRTLAVAGLAAALALAGDADGASIPLSTSPVALDPQDGTLRRTGALAFLGGLALRSTNENFGGLSGLSVGSGGRLSAVSDRGHWFTARIVRDGAGRLVDLAEGEMGPLLDTEGRPLRGAWRDAEALERLPDGDWLVSFERRHRVWRYAAETGGLHGRPTPHLAPQALASLPANGGLEALAPLADGRLLMLSQGLAGGGARAGWLVGEGGSEALRYRPAPRFKPTDAALLAGGDVLVLSRRFSLIGGFAARIERIPAAHIQAGAVLRSAPLALFRPPLTVDNFEGLAVAQDADGTTLVYLLSDDNFNAFQRTLLLLFRLDGD